MAKVFVPILPGDLSPPVTLDACLRETHEAMRDFAIGEAVRRAKLKVSTSTEVDWPAVAQQVAGATEALGPAVTKQDAAAVIEACDRIKAMVAGKAIVDPGEYQPTDGYDGVVAVFVALSADHRRKLGQAVDNAATAHRAGIDGSDVAHADAVKDYVAASIARITFGDGATWRGPFDARQLEGLELTGILYDLFVACRDYQRLSPGKGSRFGSPAPST
jgi:hypothetical protein